MKIPPVKGTRDFYPDQMKIRNFIMDGWKKVSLRNGFEEYDGPIFEYLKMFQIKSGAEIVEQLFNLTDRGGRELAIRPEITPILARMINQKINSLPRPIKWFSVPRLCRAERPQKGRLREFFQWNIDIIGVDDILADAEVIFTAVDYLKELGLTDKDIKVKYSSRKLLSLYLQSLGIPEDKLDKVYGVLDKKEKIPSNVFENMLSDIISDKNKIDKILEYMGVHYAQLEPLKKTNDKVSAAYEELLILYDYLKAMGIDNYCAYEPSIVRGLAYYTGIVFEVHDIQGDLRAICGGGRYDNLLHDFGGPKISATGFGMGDCVLQILLEEKGLLEKQLSDAGVDYFIACADEKYSKKAVEIAAKLRRKGYSANFSYKAANLTKQLKQASTQKAAKCIIVGEEIEKGQLVVKDMASGQQETVPIDEVLK